MNQETNFDRIEKAILFIKQNFKNQPSLDEIAKNINLSSFHFQRLFTEWSGVSPKKFLQYISIDYAKKVLLNNKPLLDVALDVGLSGTSRLHDLFIGIEAMTPGEYKNGGSGLEINYSYDKTLFGEIIIASTSKGICHISFIKNQKDALGYLKSCFSNAKYNNKIDLLQTNALKIFSIRNFDNLNKVKLHLKGTSFELKVWEALLKIPSGNLSTYGLVAKNINNSKACRAVGNAIGDNPIAFLIPCHRVIQSSGEFGQYRWGVNRKTAIIGWEGVYNSLDKEKND